MSATDTDTAIQRILDGPRGAKIGAFFDFDGTLIDGFSAAAYFSDRIKGRHMTTSEIVETVKLTRKKDISDDDFTKIIGDGIMQWAGIEEEELRQLWRRLWFDKVAPNMFPEMWKVVQAHKRMGHTIAIASSATPYQIEPLAEEYGIEHILATQPRIRNGKLTGGLVGKPLWGPGKANAVKAFAKKQKIDLSASYGYANGDEDILFLQTLGCPTAVQPKPKLEKVAEDSDWPTLRLPPRKRGPASAMVRTVGAYAAMGATFLAGLGYAKLTGEKRKAVDFITSMSSDAALAVLGVKVRVVNREGLTANRPCLFILNHQSKFDMFVMMHLVRTEFTGAAKIEARKVPGFGYFMEMADVAFLDRSNSDKAISALKPAVDRLKKGLSLCIAPEGTRSWTPKVGKFKKGPFYLAKEGGVPVVPVVIRNAAEIMGRNDQTMRSGIIDVAILDPVDVSGWEKSNMEEGIERVRQSYIDTLDNWPSGGKLQ